MRLLAALVGLLLVLVALDRGAVALTERRVASQLQASAGLPSEPSVSIGGFPFLTQAVRGRYGEVRLDADGVPAGTLRVTRLSATVRGLRVPLGEALAGGVRSAPADRIDARVLLSYADLSRRTGARELEVAEGGAPGTVRVTGRVRVLRQVLSVVALSEVTLEGDEIVVTAQSFDVGNGVADSLVSRALGDRLDFRIAAGALPYGLTVRGVTTTPAGVVATAAAEDVVLTATP